MRNCFPILFFLVACNQQPQEVSEKKGADNIAYKWGEISLEATANDTERFKPRPTVTSRILGLVWTAVFDAWSRYDQQALTLFLKAERRPETEHSAKNKETAISYAAFNTLMEYYYADSVLLKNFMRELGYDPENKTLDPADPVGIGNLAARTVIAARKNDGSNQYGAHPNSNGTPYSDYTGYQPVNSPDELKVLGRWQPKYFSDGQGGKFAPSCLTPQWGNVLPLMLDSANQFRSGPPPAVGSAQLANEVKEAVELQSTLTPSQKALVEFMRDGPKSVQQAGHWLIFAQDVSIRDNHTLDDDVKMYFLVLATAMDAFIAAWDTKMKYDYARPYALVHDQYKGKTIKGWGGPDKGMIEMKGEEWRPYSPETFLCPPFPSYVSGHSCVSGACAEALRQFTGKDDFGLTKKMIAGVLTEPDHASDTVTLDFPTFTETAEMAGLSRVLGGYHIQADNVEGLKLGRRVSSKVWERYLKLIGENPN